MPPKAFEGMTRHRWLALALLLSAVQAVLLLHTAWDKSDTIDEPYYLATAVDQWTFLDFSRCDAPALPRWGFAAALRLVDPRLFDPDSKSGRNPLWSRPMAIGRRNLFVARLSTIALTVAGGLWLWRAARRFGDVPGAVAHALWCFSPAVLANGSLATLDAWAASFACLVLWRVVHFLEDPSPWQAAFVGLALALAAAAKITTLGLVPVAAGAGAWVVLGQSAGEARRPLGRLAAVLGVAALAFVVTLWAVYAFNCDTVDTGRVCEKETGLPHHVYGPLPFAPFFGGILLQWLHGNKGHLSYLFGATSGSGWWWFYLAALAFKTTIGAQLLGLLLLVARWRAPRLPGGWWLDAGILAYPLLLVVVLSLGKTQNGIRYILPAYPFLMLWAGRSSAVALRLDRRAGLAVGGALLLGALESVAVHPHHLMFFNLWAGGPSGGPRYLIHGDDWGQEQRRLGEWQRENHPWRLYYTPYNGLPHYWGISADVPPCEPRPGYYALHAVEVHRPKRLRAGCLDWLTVEPPDERLGYSIYLYLVTRERIERLEKERGHTVPFWQSGTGDNVTEPAAAPSNPSAPVTEEPEGP